MSETKAHDTITYLGSTKFFETYSLGKGLSAGTFGEVYLSGDAYIVKKFITEDSVLDLAKELNIYSSYIHPCILKPRNWTVKKNIAYMAMDRGEDIKDAFKEGKIGIKEIASDTLSALTFLNHQGIVHGDIKPDNIVYHDGYAKLIDMGLARRARLSEEGYYVTGSIYTSPYKDVEYWEDQENNIKCEIYALAMTYLDIITTKQPQFGEISTFTNSSNTGIEWFFNQASKLQANRSSIQTLLKTAPSDLVIRYHTADMYHDPLFEQDPNCGKNLSVVMNNIVKILYKNNCEAETLFLALHLSHRVHQPLVDQYEGDNLGNYSYNISMAVIILATYIMNDKHKLSVKELVGYDSDIIKELYYAIIDVMIISNGIISSFSYWDYAASREDLFPLLLDVISCRYNPTLIRKTIKGVNKCVLVRDFISSAQIKLFDKVKTKDQMWENIAFDTFPVKVTTCVLDVGGDYKQLKGWWGFKEVNLKRDDFKEIENYYSVTLRNRDQLPRVGMDMALKIYEAFLNGGKSLDSFVLDTICKVDWRTLGKSVITNKIFPF